MVGYMLGSGGIQFEYATIIIIEDGSGDQN
jgi:hypothetical protein